MNKIAERVQNIAQSMAEDKKKVEEYVKSGRTSKKPKGIKFIKPFSL